MPELYCGPCSLEKALAAAIPDPETGIRLAVSCPYGCWIAVQVAAGPVRLRRANGVSGHAGSVLGTGEWRDAVGRPVDSWRPA